MDQNKYSPGFDEGVFISLNGAGAQALVTPAVLRASCFKRRVCVRLPLEARLGLTSPGLSVLVAMESTPSSVQ